MTNNSLLYAFKTILPAGFRSSVLHKMYTDRIQHLLLDFLVVKIQVSSNFVLGFLPSTVKKKNKNKKTRKTPPKSVKINACSNRTQATHAADRRLG